MSAAKDRRRQYFLENPILEFANPADLPEAGPIVTYRRGTKWMEKARLGMEVTCAPAHSQSGPRRKMRITELERLERDELPPEVAAHLFMFYGPLARETFVRITLEDT